MQKSFITGRLTRAPEMRLVGAADPIQLAEFDLATDHFKRGGEKYTSYYHVKAWGKDADNIHKYFKDGDGIVVECQMQQERWDDKATGKGRERVVHHVKSWEFGPKSLKNERGDRRVAAGPTYGAPKEEPLHRPPPKAAATPVQQPVPDFDDTDDIPF